MIAAWNLKSPLSNSLFHNYHTCVELPPPAQPHRRPSRTPRVICILSFVITGTDNFKNQGNDPNTQIDISFLVYLLVFTTFSLCQA